VLLVAGGASLLWDRRIFAGVMITIVGLGIAGGVRNLMTQRTQRTPIVRRLRVQRPFVRLLERSIEQWCGQIVHGLLPLFLCAPKVTRPCHG